MGLSHDTLLASTAIDEDIGTELLQITKRTPERRQYCRQRKGIT